MDNDQEGRVQGKGKPSPGKSQDCPKRGTLDRKNTSIGGGANSGTTFIIFCSWWAFEEEGKKNGIYSGEGRKCTLEGGKSIAESHVTEIGHNTNSALVQRRFFSKGTKSRKEKRQVTQTRA